MLGVPANASVPAIRNAYRKKALKAHPDRGGDAESFVLLQRAYRSLLEARGEGLEGPERSRSQTGKLALKHQAKPAGLFWLYSRSLLTLS